MRVIVLIAAFFICSVVNAQQRYQPNALTRFVKTGSTWVMQYDSLGNGTWVAVPSIGYMQSYVAQHAGGGNPNSNIGSGYRLAVPNTNNIKTISVGVGNILDSIINANSVTVYSDTLLLSTRAWRQKGIDSVMSVVGTTYIPLTRTINGKALSSNVTLSLASSDFSNQGTATTVLHGNASGNPSWSSVIEADMNLSDNTTNNASTLRHGFLPKLSGSSSQYLDGTGNFSTPTGGGGGGGLSDSTVVVFNTWADLQASTIYSTVKYARTKGYYEINDGGAAFYAYIDTSTAVNDSSLATKPLAVIGNGRWIYQLDNGTYNVRQLGVKPNNGSTDNWYRLQHIINTVPNLQSSVIYAPGSLKYYYCSQTIDFTNKNLVFEGDGYGTDFRVPGGMVGIKCGPVIGDMIFRNFQITALGKDPNDGHSGGVQSHDPEDYHYHGMYIQARCIVENVYINYFSGAAIRMYGNIEANGSNVSASHLSDVKASQCGIGFWVANADASAIEIENLDTRDSDAWGILSDTFFGNSYIGGEHHNNAFGHFKQRSGIAHDVFIQTYFEGQAAIDTAIGYITGIGAWFGSYPALGPNINLINGQYVDQIVAVNSTMAGVSDAVGITHDGAQPFLGRPQLSLITSSTSNIGYYLKNKGGRGNQYSMQWQWKAPYWGDTLSQFDLNGINIVREIGNQKRGLRKIALGLAAWHYEGINLVQWAPNTTSIISSPYLVGDKIYNSSYDGTNPLGWTCIAGGSTPDFGGGMPLGTSTGDNKIAMTGISWSREAIQEGDVINIGGNIRTVTAKNNTNDTLTVNSVLPVMSTPTNIDPVAPTWKAFGPASGTTAQRPTLTSTDQGFVYFDTDLSTNITWSGTAWITGAVSSLAIVNDANYTVASGVSNVILSNSTADRTFTLPDPATNTNRKITITHSGGAFAINFSRTVRTNSTTTHTSMTQGKVEEIMSDGSEWWAVSIK